MNPISARPVWFEIPVVDLDRATRFYETLFGITLQRESMGPMTMAVFPHEEMECGGALILGQPFVPSAQGCVVYLSAGPSLDATLARVAPAGGAILVGKTLISPEIGYYAQVRDSEGNTLGLCAVD